MLEHKIEDSLAIRRTEKSKIPFTAEELLAIGRKFVRIRGIPARLQEDAIQEFVVAGQDVLIQSGENVRAYQFNAGKWAVANFCRMMSRCRMRESRVANEKFGILYQGGDFDEEAVIDPECRSPWLDLINREEKQVLQKAITQLPQNEREVLLAIVYGGRSQKELSEERKVEHSHISGLFHAAIFRLQKMCPSLDKKKI